MHSSLLEAHSCIVEVTEGVGVKTWGWASTQCWAHSNSVPLRPPRTLMYDDTAVDNRWFAELHITELVPSARGYKEVF